MGFWLAKNDWPFGTKKARHYYCGAFLPSNTFPGICIAVSFPRKILFPMMAQTSRFVIVKVNRAIGRHAASKVNILSGGLSACITKRFSARQGFRVFTRQCQNHIASDTNTIEGIFTHFNKSKNAMFAIDKHKKTTGQACSPR